MAKQLIHRLSILLHKFRPSDSDNSRKTNCQRFSSKSNNVEHRVRVERPLPLRIKPARALEALGDSSNELSSEGSQVLSTQLNLQLVWGSAAAAATAQQQQ